ncbi:MAG: permease-like cell division protein FtsX [bacterium]
MNAIFRILLYGVQGFRRNIWLSIIAIITMTLTITTISIFAVGDVVANKKYQEFNDRIDYNVFIKDSASDADVTQLRDQVTARSEVAASTYLSKEDVRARFDTFFKNIESLKGIITSDNNPLPREIDVRFKDPGQIDQFDSFIRQDRYKQVVDKTSYQDNKDLITTYVRLTNFFKVFGLSFTGFFVMIAILVILNTIRLAIYARREEIEVMRLVGATRGFIRGPFLIEGVLFGVLGALISGVLSWAFLLQLRSLLQSSFSSQTSNFVTDLFGTSLGGITNTGGLNVIFLELFALQLGVGLLLGVLCSSMAVRRYLKE